MSAWRIRIDPAKFRQLQGEPAFAEVLTLGRISNLLRAMTASGFEHGPHDVSASERARSASTLLLTGLLAEAFPVLERCGKYFRHLPGFESAILPILKDSELARLRKDWLAPMRNQAVFHNDAEVSLKGLEYMNGQVAHDIARGSSEEFMDSYFPLADAVAVAYVIGSGGHMERGVEFLEWSATAVVEAAIRMCNAIDTLVGQALHDFGLESSAG